MTHSHLLGGKATFDTILGWPSGPSSLGLAASQSRPDEFLRPEQTIQLSIPAVTLWDWLYPGGPAPELASLRKLAARLTVTPYDAGTPQPRIDLKVQSFSGSEIWDLRAVTGTAQIPNKADQLRFELSITDTASGQTTTIGQDMFEPRAVFAGTLPAKTLLFDSTPSFPPVFRERVIDGGAPIAGATLLFGYTEYRADTLVDAARIDRQIGTMVSGGRMGPVTVPVYGTLVHDISYGVSFDDGQPFYVAPLSPSSASRILGPNRTCYEASIGVPANATRMWLYIHVKTSLVANYPGGSDVTKWYPDGAVLPRAEAWDNPGRRPFVNYELLVEG